MHDKEPLPQTVISTVSHTGVLIFANTANTGNGFCRLVSRAKNHYIILLLICQGLF